MSMRSIIRRRGRLLVLVTAMGIPMGIQGCMAGAAGPGQSGASSDALRRTKVFLAAGDYRRAVEACQEEVRARPSAASYVYLTYVYQAIHGYLEFHATGDRWGKIEQLVRNLSGDRPEVLIDPPDILARIAKEIIGESVQRESDVTAAMATRLDRPRVEVLWRQQTAWRAANPETWWHGVPVEWPW